MVCGAGIVVSYLVDLRCCEYMTMLRKVDAGLCASQVERQLACYFPLSSARRYLFTLIVEKGLIDIWSSVFLQSFNLS